jgi:hypothetical protein
MVRNIRARPWPLVVALPPRNVTCAPDTGLERPPERVVARKLKRVRRPRTALAGDTVSRICGAPEPDDPVWLPWSPQPLGRRARPASWPGSEFGGTG